MIPRFLLLSERSLNLFVADLDTEPLKEVIGCSGDGSSARVTGRPGWWCWS